MTAARALLSGIVDYAGVFPPASLDLVSALGGYASYQDDPASWMLGRFIAPVAKLDDAQSALLALARSAPIRVSATLGPDALGDIDRVHRFNAVAGDAMIVDAVEGRFTEANAIREAAARVGNSLVLFAEIASEPDPGALMDAIAAGGAKAKIRTGGVIPEAFPPAGDVVRFMRRCLDAGVAFKATAGLHHPLRAEYRLTYESAAACGSMFGFVNVFVAAAFLKAGATDADAETLLMERDPSVLQWSSDRLTWERGSGAEPRRLTSDELLATRRDFALSFGSCSFREPVDELRVLGWIE